MLSQQDVQDQIALAFLRDYGIRTYGLEFGNWYGFAGIPMSTSISSFVEILGRKSEGGMSEFEARVVMPHLDANATFCSRLVDNMLMTKFDLVSNSDSLLGDVVIHMTLSALADQQYFNGALLKYLARYVYSDTNLCMLRIGDKMLRIKSGYSVPNGIDMELIPYASRLSDGRVRYHSRLLSRGGKNSHLILRSRGSATCLRIGKWRRWVRPWLYRVERSAPKFMRNTQLCSVVDFPEGASLSLWHQIETL